MAIIGREQEQKLLQQIWQSPKAEFVAAYGRRRIGKTYLIREYFEKKPNTLYIEVTGSHQKKTAIQLSNFASGISKTFFSGMPMAVPKNWNEAFQLLTTELQKIKQKKVIVFLDELPWLATKRSDCLHALEYFWNTEWSRLKNLKLIVCGSAASWMLNDLIHAKGGLHNRLTRVMHLKPFNLKDTAKFLQAKKCKFSHKQILDLYLVMGGVPFYLDHIEKSLSVIQNINQSAFASDGVLQSEFLRLFKSLFDNADICEKLIRAIASKRYGLSREELLRQIEVKSGGWINDRLDELIAAGFVSGFVPYGKKRKDIYYRVVDEYTLFYLRWIEPILMPGYDVEKNYWHNTVKTSAWMAWAGYAFESVCLKHVNEIKKALGLEHIAAIVGGWRHVPPKGKLDRQGTQIDLLFDRNDDAITLCEIKYSVNQFAIDKNYARQLMNKMQVFGEYFKTNKQLCLGMITTSGLKSGVWREELVDGEVILTDLFG